MRTFRLRWGISGSTPKTMRSYESLCGEVDDIEYLSPTSQLRTRAAARASIEKVFDYIGVRSS